MDIWKWLKDNGTVIIAIGAILTILNLTGFSLNVPEYYRSLESDGKIIFVLIFNTLVTLVLFSIAIGKKVNKK